MKAGAILVTGGTGFIGAEIVRQLLARGEQEIHVLHRSGNFQRIQDLLERVDPIQVELADGARLAEIVAAVRPRAIYHLGAILTGPGEADPQAATMANAFGTYALLEAARRHEVCQLLFASSIGVYGADIVGEVITDLTLQRPFTIYGITKVFGEQLGAFYRRKYGLDFRGLRYPSIVGPGVKTPSVVQFTSWVIEECAKGNPFTMSVRPETAVPVMYYKDAARAMIQLGEAPAEGIRTVNYLVDGAKPTPTAGRLAEIVRSRIPGARIGFEPNPILQPAIDQTMRPLDDGRARAEWGWEPAYDEEAMVDDFLAEWRAHPERYR
jgi:threonine 3-dehydrogenase